MNIEDITTDDDNRLILSDMKRNTEEDSQLALWIQNEHQGEIEIDDDQGYQFSLKKTLYFYYLLFTLIVCYEMQPKTPDYRFNKAQVAIDNTTVR